MYKLTQALVVVASVALHSSLSFADTCQQGYPRSERAAVLRYERPAGVILDRMATLAEMSTESTRWVPQMALDQEFQALKPELSEVGKKKSYLLSDRAKGFLGATINSGYLGLAASTVLAEDLESSVIKAREALSQVQGATDTLKVCLSGSWDHVALSGKPNDGMCAGGFSKGDRALAYLVVSRARSDLLKLNLIAKSSKLSVFPATQRQLNQDSFDYLREDLQLLGEKRLPRVSTKTQRFLRTVINPVYLGLKDSSVQGTTVAEAQKNAAQALFDLKNAEDVLKKCAYAF